MRTLEDSEVRELFKTASKEGKEILIKRYGFELFFNFSEVKKIPTEEPLLEKSESAGKELRKIISVCNKTWTGPVRVGRLYYPTFDKTSGVLVHTGTDCVGSDDLNAAAGGGFGCKSRAISDYVGENFLNLWEDYFMKE